VGHVKSCDLGAITFYEHDIIESGLLGPHPSLFIVAFMEGQNFKRVLIDNGSSLNVISSSSLNHINIPQSSIFSSTLEPRTFNDTISTTMSTIVFPLKVGPRIVHTLFHVIEGNLQYNLLLGRPWIDEMKCVPYTLHQYIKFIDEGKLTCVKAYPEPFRYCNFIASYDDFLSSTHLVPFVPPSTSNVVTYSHIVNDNVITSSNVVVPSEVPSSGESSAKAIVSYTSPQVGEYK